ncbi:MAG: DinB family protein [Propionibacteriales bacterium]|nr:DinB family protein [Propionibacteriales bacterium]
MSQSPLVGTESELLLAYLNAQRQHVLGILEGLDEEALRRPMMPSGWNCLGLVRHLALDDERFWFRAVVAGEEIVIQDLAEAPDDAWQVGPDVAVESVFDAYRQQIDLANAIISSTPLDSAPAWWPEELFGSWRLDNLREIILHVLTETAVHAGHLDATRELIDGRTWLVLTE